MATLLTDTRTLDPAFSSSEATFCPLTEKKVTHEEETIPAAEKSQPSADKFVMELGSSP